MRRETEAQIMLLSAILLVIGFVALGAMLSRVELATSRTVQVQESPLILEAGQLAQAVDRIIIGIADNQTAGSPDFYANLTATLAELAALETARGVPMHFDTALSDASLCSGGVGRVRVTLLSATTTVTFQSQETHAC